MIQTAAAAQKNYDVKGLPTIVFLDSSARKNRSLELLDL